MCEIVIRVRDKAPDHHPLHKLKTHRGDIIEVMPDGWRWSKMELTNPEWRIVRLIGLPMDALGDMQQAVTDRDGMIIAKRARGFDLDAIPHVELKWLQGAVVELLDADRIAFLAARKNKATGAKVIG